MPYKVFLFDADDTLFDFAGAEFQAFSKTLSEFGIVENIESIYATYKVESYALWQLVEQNKMTKESLRSERFRKTFTAHAIDAPCEKAGHLYLEILPELCLLVDHAIEICKYLAEKGTIGIITNGFQTVQERRLKISGLADYVQFMVVSEGCGFAKPDERFFAHAATYVTDFSKKKTLVIGDRLETDILGAHRFGLDSCWFNPRKANRPKDALFKYEINHLSELRKIVDANLR